jgi:hypothetical protein
LTLSRTYDIDQIAEIGTTVFSDLVNGYWDLAHGTRTAGAARDSMFQVSSQTSNVGPGSGGVPTESPGASAMSEAWMALFERFERAMTESGTALERLQQAVLKAAHSMSDDEDVTQIELAEIQAEIDSKY